MGRFTTKTEPHQNLSSSAPPTRGPAAMASPLAPDQIAMAIGRSRSLKTAEIRDRVAGMISALPTPIAPRAMISSVTPVDIPAQSEAAPNNAMPITSSRRWP